MGTPFRKTFVIGTLDCDALGHMNVAKYFALCNTTGFAMQTSLGWIPGAPNQGRRYSFAVVQADSTFLSEVLSGAEMVVETGISRIGTKSADFANRILDAQGAPVFRSTWRSALLDLDTRRGVAVPDDLRAALATYAVAPE